MGIMVVFLVMGNAGFTPSTVLQPLPRRFRVPGRQAAPESQQAWKETGNGGPDESMWGSGFRV